MISPVILTAGFLRGIVGHRWDALVGRSAIAVLTSIAPSLATDQPLASGCAPGTREQPSRGDRVDSGNHKPSLKGSVVVAVVAQFAMIAPALAQWPQPSSTELFGKFDCHIAMSPTCLCSQDNGSHEVVYEQLLVMVAAYPIPAGGEADRRVVQSKWRRQCGLLDQADTTP